MTKEELPRYQELKLKNEFEQEIEEVQPPKQLSETSGEIFIKKALINEDITELNMSPRSDGGPVSEGEEEILMIK